MLTISTTPLAPSIPDPRHVFCLRAREAYEDAVNVRSCDGAVSPKSWWAIAGDLHLAATYMRDANALQGFIDCVLARATDAEMRAQYAERMVQVAAAQSSVIDLGTLIGGAS